MFFISTVVFPLCPTALQWRAVIDSESVTHRLLPMPSDRKLNCVDFGPVRVPMAMFAFSIVVFNEMVAHSIYLYNVWFKRKNRPLHVACQHLNGFLIGET